MPLIDRPRPGDIPHRLGDLVIKTSAALYGWALMPNHDSIRFAPLAPYRHLRLRVGVMAAQRNLVDPLVGTPPYRVPNRRTIPASLRAFRQNHAAPDRHPQLRLQDKLQREAQCRQLVAVGRVVPGLR